MLDEEFVGAAGAMASGMERGRFLLFAAEDGLGFIAATLDGGLNVA